MTYLQRKKRAFMSIVNKVKGFVRTVSGAPPLTLPDCVDEDSLINYTISGNSMQDGTPTPDAPIEIESVGELVTDENDVNYGKYKIPVKASCKQLIPYPYYTKSASYKGVDITYNEDGSLTLNGTHTNTTVSNLTLFLKDTLKLPKGTYTMSCEGLTTSNSVYMVVSINGTYRIIYGNNKYTFTFDEDIYLGAGYIQFAVGAVFDNVTVKPLIERGSEATGYEPYVEPITTNIYLNEPLSAGRVLEYPKDNIPKLPTFKGTTVYSIETTVQPSNMSATYYSTSKGD